MLTVLAAGFRVPLTELTGEALVAHAAETSRTNWHERIDERRMQFAEPEIVVPLVAWYRNILAGRPDPTPAFDDMMDLGVRWSPWNDREDGGEDDGDAALDDDNPDGPDGGME